MIRRYLQQIELPQPDSRKGENGRVLVIGGSKLFHAASFWSACMAAKIVDMVHFSSPAMENNELMRVRAKEKFWEGIVVPWENVEHYIEEDDCILIGPGMTRSQEKNNELRIANNAGERNTGEIVNTLLAKYPEKKWVVDGGALQEVEAKLLTVNMIITPNVKEWERVEGRIPEGVTVLQKGPTDVVWKGEERVEVAGGSPGMTKGGTGDVLSGLVCGLYAKSPAMASCVVASQVNKRAGEQLEKLVGPFFSAGELIGQVQKVLAKVVK